MNFKIFSSNLNFEKHNLDFKEIIQMNKEEYFQY